MADQWFLAPSLAALRLEVNQRWPNRDRSSDGSVGDTSHAARKSDHNPDWSAPGDRRGIVRAYDLDEDLDGNPTNSGAELQWLVDHLVARRDPRILYVIYEGRMWRSYDKPGIPAWTPGPYTGANAHRHHMHISIQSTFAAEQDTRPWLPEEDPMSALSDAEQRELLRLLRQVHAETAAPEDGRLREVTLLARSLAGGDPLEPADIAAGGTARPLLKTLVQGALLDGLREKTEANPERGLLREPFKDLLREVLDSDPAPSVPPAG